MYCSYTHTPIHPYIPGDEIPAGINHQLVESTCRLTRLSGRGLYTNGGWCVKLLVALPKLRGTRGSQRLVSRGLLATIY